MGSNPVRHGTPQWQWSKSTGVSLPSNEAVAAAKDELAHIDYVNLR